MDHKSKTSTCFGAAGAVLLYLETDLSHMRIGFNMGYMQTCNEFEIHLKDPMRMMLSSEPTTPE